MHLWLHQAQCQDAEPELFFPASEDETLPAVAAQVAAAKAVCAGCPVSGGVGWALAWDLHARGFGTGTQVDVQQHESRHRAGPDGR